MSHHPSAKDGLLNFITKSERSDKKFDLVPKHPTKVKEEILDQINDDDNYYLEQTMEEYAENPYDLKINRLLFDFCSFMFDKGLMNIHFNSLR